jgi:probable rRNA maturation factor
MRAVNKKYLKHDYVTDVLTFDLGDNIGEVIICPQTAHANAKMYRTSTEKEIVLYVIHGLLHLAGFDDHNHRDMLRMRRMEEKLI